MYEGITRNLSLALRCLHINCIRYCRRRKVVKLFITFLPRQKLYLIENSSFCQQCRDSVRTTMALLQDLGKDSCRNRNLPKFFHLPEIVAKLLRNYVQFESTLLRFYLKWLKLILLSLHFATRAKIFKCFCNNILKVSYQI